MKRVLLIAMLLSHAAFASETAAHVFDLLEGSRLEEARPIVEAERDRPGVGPLLAGAYDFYRGAYADAVLALDKALADPSLDPRLAGEGDSLRKLAKAADEATRGFETHKSAHFEIKVGKKDDVIAEPALDALERAYIALADDLGEHPPGPIRVEIYGDIADLAKVSPLTLSEIQTSGTIALSKYDRLMATSPRALVAGYAWIDTLTHELTHYFITRASHNTVPIWLHEGIAKTEERRWREPFGGSLPKTLEHLIASGLHDGHMIPFSAMYPSIAKLPSQEDAGLAYAEVATAIQYLTDGRGAAPLRKLLALLREGTELGRAITIVSGKSFASFERSWRAWLKTRGLKMHPELGMAKLHFQHDDGKKSDDNDDDAGATKIDPRASGHVRLGTMLRNRHRLAAAASEYERASTVLGVGHPSVAARLANTYLELKAWDRAIAVARPGLERRPDSAGLQVTLGRALLEKGDAAGARTALEGALAVNPYNPLTRCGLARAYRTLADARMTREENACATLGGTP